MRTLAVSALSAALAALYAERKVASGTRPRNEETLMTCPLPRAVKCGTIACIP